MHLPAKRQDSYWAPSSPSLNGDRRRLCRG